MKEELISAVQSCPVLWDKSHKQHNNRHVLKREWRKIAFQLGTTDQHIRYVWKNIRQEFGKQLRKTLKANSDGSDKIESSWPYFESMLFMTNQFNQRRPRKSNDNLTSTFDESVIYDHLEEVIDNVDSPKIPLDHAVYAVCSINDSPGGGNEDSPNVSKKSDSTKTKTDCIKKVNPQTVFVQPLLDLAKEKLKLKQNSGMENPSDEDVGFFISLLPHVRNLSPRNKLLFRMQVQNILFDLSYNAEQSSGATPSSLDHTDHSRS